MIQLHQEIDFSDTNSELSEFIRQASEEIVRKQAQEDMNSVYKPTLNLDFGSYVIVNNLPRISEDKQTRLSQALRALLNKWQMAEQYSDVTINLSGQGLIKFVNEESAQTGAKCFNGFPLDAKHQLQAFTIKELDGILSTESTYNPLRLLSRKELQGWLCDGRNQLLVIQERIKLSMQWWNPLEWTMSEFVKENPMKKQYEKVEWSPNGTYLVVYLEEGWELYGGSNLQRVHGFPHRRVQKVELSQDEEYAISFNGTCVSTNESENYIVWKIREELKLRVFKAEQFDVLGTYQFNKNMLCRIDNDFLSIYMAPHFHLWEKRMSVPNVQNFIWIPRTNQLVYAAYTGISREHDRNLDKTSIMIVEIPSKKETKWRNIQFECGRCDLFANDQGRWVVAILKKKIKRKVVSTIIQVANLKKQTAQLEIIDKEVQEEFESVFFDSRSGRFAISYRDKDKNQRALPFYNFHFYCIIDEGRSLDLKDMGYYKEKDTNELMWASNGQYFVMLNKQRNSPDQGKLEFGVVHKRLDKEMVVVSTEITKSTNHFYMSHAQWDPSGIYFVTMSDQWASVIIWSAIGEQLLKDTITKINEIQWRPKPINLLDEKEENKLIAESKVFIKKYEEEDDKVINKAKYQREEKRKAMAEQFQALMAAKKKQWVDHRNTRKQLLGFDEDDHSQLITLTIIDREEIVPQQSQ